jgi:hypothetical protein
VSVVQPTRSAIPGCLTLATSLLGGTIVEATVEATLVAAATLFSRFPGKFQWIVFARMHTVETTAEGHDRGLELLRHELLPWLRESTGFRGLLRLATPDRSKMVVITLWADEAALLETAEAGRGLGALAAEAAGSKRIALEDYEVTFLDAEFTRKDIST